MRQRKVVSEQALSCDTKPLQSWDKARSGEHAREFFEEIRRGVERDTASLYKLENVIGRPLPQEGRYQDVRICNNSHQPRLARRYAWTSRAIARSESGRPLARPAMLESRGTSSLLMMTIPPSVRMATRSDGLKTPFGRAIVKFLGSSMVRIVDQSLSRSIRDVKVR